MALEEKVLEINDKIDAKVDGLIDAGKSSRFSWLMIGGAVLALLVIVGLLAAY